MCAKLIKNVDSRQRRLRRLKLEFDTFWERAARTRWGAYLTRLEEAAVSHALILASPPDLALEVGCEGGRWVRVLCDAGWRVHATDVDADAMAICRERNPNAECFLVSPSDRTLPEEDLAVKLIMCMEVAPVVSSNWFIPECARVLKPGGWVVGVYYNSLSLRGWAHRLKRRLKRQSENGYYESLPYHKYRRKWLEMGFRIAYEDGYAWAPFNRQSESPLIPLAARLERGFGLNRIASLSPCVVFIARKS